MARGLKTRTRLASVSPGARVRAGSFKPGASLNKHNAMTAEQRSFKLHNARPAGLSKRQHQEEQRALNGRSPVARAVSPRKLLADMLRRQADRVMDAVTESPSANISAHVQTLDNVSELIRFVLRNEMVDDCERRMSDRQLTYAQTLADYLEALKLTRQHHRAPCWTSGRDEQLREINRKLDVLAGCFAQSPALNQVLDESEVES